MGRRIVTAVQLSDIFARRFRDLHPLSKVAGFMVQAQGEGEWLPLGYLGRMDDGLSADGAAILQAMKTEFLIDEYERGANNPKRPYKNAPCDAVG
jgi:hypothetical protein